MESTANRQRRIEGDLIAAVHARFRSPLLCRRLSAHKTRQRPLLRHAMTFCRSMKGLQRNVATVGGDKYRDVRSEEDSSLPLEQS